MNRLVESTDSLLLYCVDKRDHGSVFQFLLQMRSKTAYRLFLFECRKFKSSRSNARPKLSLPVYLRAFLAAYIVFFFLRQVGKSLFLGLTKRHVFSREIKGSVLIVSQSRSPIQQVQRHSLQPDFEGYNFINESDVVYHVCPRGFLRENASIFLSARQTQKILVELGKFILSRWNVVFLYILTGSSHHFSKLVSFVVGDSLISGAQEIEGKARLAMILQDSIPGVRRWLRYGSESLVSLWYSVNNKVIYESDMFLPSYTTFPEYTGISHFLIITQQQKIDVARLIERRGVPKEDTTFEFVEPLDLNRRLVSYPTLMLPQKKSLYIFDEPLYAKHIKRPFCLEEIDSGIDLAIVKGFWTEVISLASMHRIEIYGKTKNRDYSSSRIDFEYLDFLKTLNINWISKDGFTSSFLKPEDIVICLPYSTAAIIAQRIGCPVCYFYPSEGRKISAQHGVSICNTKPELAQFIGYAVGACNT